MNSPLLAGVFIAICCWCTAEGSKGYTALDRWGNTLWSPEHFACCAKDNCKNYRGKVNTPLAYRASCVYWSKTYRHYRPENYPDAGLEKNYCRNPNGAKAPWCYLRHWDSHERYGQKSWAYCIVCKGGDTCCNDNNRHGEGCADYRGSIAITKSGRECQFWDTNYPHKHWSITPETKPNAGLEKNYCRNPSKHSNAWCYTTDHDKRWENCFVCQAGCLGRGELCSLDNGLENGGCCPTHYVKGEHSGQRRGNYWTTYFHPMTCKLNKLDNQMRCDTDCVEERRTGTTRLYSRKDSICCWGLDIPSSRHRDYHCYRKDAPELID